jgi:hypothetical protein
VRWLHRIAFVCSISLFHAFLLQSTDIDTAIQKKKDVCITIFVHGIISIQPYLSLTNIIRLKQDRIGDTVYARAVELTRKNEFFYQHHPMQKLGLHKIDLNAIAPGNAAAAFARAYNTLAQKSGYGRETNLYYTFGWSGLLSRKMRTLEAEIFYKDLVELLEPYYKQDIFPTLRIIGYSHGGRMALELAVAHHLLDTSCKITIDELILIGMPVAQSSITKIKDPIFKKVYHIYSESDRVQRIDFFSVKGFLSNRTFKSSSCSLLPEKLTQINFKFFRASRFCQEECACMIHCTLYCKHVRPAHPGHVELWSFGWSPKSYRQSLPYYPLPGAVFIPNIIQSTQRTPCKGHHVKVEIHSHRSLIVVKTKGTDLCYTLPFLSYQELVLLRTDALQAKPYSFTQETFDCHSQQARELAKYQKKVEWFTTRGKICRF